MLEQIGEALGPDRRLEGPGGADITGDQGELALDRGGKSPGSIMHQGVETRDRTVEPLDGLRERPLAAAAVVVERDDLCHARTIRPGSDMAGRLERLCGPLRRRARS